MRTIIIIIMLNLLFNQTNAQANPATTAEELGITINKISEQQLAQTYKALKKRQQRFEWVRNNPQKRFELIIEEQGQLELMPLLETIHQAAQHQTLPARFDHLGYSPVETYSYKFNNKDNPHLILPSSLFYPLTAIGNKQLVKTLIDKGLNQSDIDTIKAYKKSKLTPWFMHFKQAAHHTLENLTYMQSLISLDQSVDYAQLYTFVTDADYQLKKQTQFYWRQWGLELLKQFTPAKQNIIINTLLTTSIRNDAVPSHVYFNTPSHLKSLVESLQSGDLEQRANQTLVQLEKKLSGELAAERKREYKKQQQLTPEQRQKLAKQRQDIINKIDEHLKNNTKKH